MNSVNIDTIDYIWNGFKLRQIQTVMVWIFTVCSSLRCTAVKLKPDLQNSWHFLWLLPVNFFNFIETDYVDRILHVYIVFQIFVFMFRRFVEHHTLYQGHVEELDDFFCFFHRIRCRWFDFSVVWRTGSSCCPSKTSTFSHRTRTLAHHCGFELQCTQTWLTCPELLVR